MAKRKQKGPVLNHTGYVGKVIQKANGDRYLIENDILLVNNVPHYMTRPTDRGCMFSWETFHEKSKTDEWVKLKVWKITELTDAEKDLTINSKYRA